jgi:hypothetical protein
MQKEHVTEGAGAASLGGLTSEERRAMEEENALAVARQAKLHAALATAQGAMKNPERNRTVHVRTDKGSYTFDYATLDSIIDGAREALSKNGIAVTQALERTHDGQTVMVTRLLHKDGGCLVSELPVDLPRGGRIQELGSLITYARRYALCAILNIAAEEDDDGAGSDKKASGPRGQPPAPAPKAPEAGSPRAEYKRIMAEMQAAEDAVGLAQVLLDNKDAILKVKEASEEGYDKLMREKDSLVKIFGGAKP